MQLTVHDSADTQALRSLVLQGERPAGSACPPPPVQTPTAQHRDQLCSGGPRRTPGACDAATGTWWDRTRLSFKLLLGDLFIHTRVDATSVMSLDKWQITVFVFHYYTIIATHSPRDTTVRCYYGADCRKWKVPWWVSSRCRVGPFNLGVTCGLYLEFFLNHEQTLFFVFFYMKMVPMLLSCCSWVMEMIFRVFLPPNFYRCPAFTSASVEQLSLASC